MDRRRERTPTFFTRLVYGFGGKWRRITAQLSKSIGPPAPQTSLSTSSRFTPLDRVLNVNLFHSVFVVFELPDELILSILSHLSPGPQLTGHYSRFRVQYSMKINDYHDRRTQFLRSLSMTCRAMRLRLLSWIWERVKCLKLVPCWYSAGGFPGEFSAITRALRADTSLATSVRYFICSSLQEPLLELNCILCRFMTICLMWGDSVLPLFVGCLESLPNLHTLEIGQVHGFIDAPLRKALSGVNLPQIKTLVLPPATYPLLNHCSDVEDVVCVIGYRTILSEEFLESLTSNPDSKVKRLAIPLVSRSNPSRE